MARRLLIDGVDEIKGVMGEVALIRLRFDPDRKEFGTQVSGPSFVEADVAVILGIGRSDVVAFVEKALGCVGMRVDDDRRVLDLKSFLADNRLCTDGKNTAKRDCEVECEFVHGEYGFYTTRLGSGLTSWPRQSIEAIDGSACEFCGRSRATRKKD